MSDDNELRRLLHDLNNALTRILTTAELIESEGEPNGQLVEDARAIRDAAIEGRDITQTIREEALRSRAAGRRPDSG